MANRLKLTIDGMTCGHCVAAVCAALERLPGVAVESVEIGSATLHFDPARASAPEIVEAVYREGFAAYVVT